MDTTTVLEIIKMIDVRIKGQRDRMEAKGLSMVTPTETALTELGEHLQSFIEGQLNAVENSTGE